MFVALQGNVRDINESRARITIEIKIFGKPVPVELEEAEVELV
jgi:transcription antitermination factor NusG